MVEIGTNILQRIADLGNWLTSDEKSAVSEAYNMTVSVFMVLERTLFNTYGADKVTTHGGSAPLKKSVNDFIGWRDEGYKLADDIDDFIHSPGLKYVYDDDKHLLRSAHNRILRLVYDVMDIAVTVPAKD